MYDLGNLLFVGYCYSSVAVVVIVIVVHPLQFVVRPLQFVTVCGYDFVLLIRSKVGVRNLGLGFVFCGLGGQNWVREFEIGVLIQIPGFRFEYGLRGLDSSFWG